MGLVQPNNTTKAAVARPFVWPFSSSIGTPQDTAVGYAC
jgi:hypothetical protein